MNWIKKRLPLILIILIIAVNAVTVTLLIKRANPAQVTAGFDKPDKIIVALGEKECSFPADTAEYAELYERCEARCRKLAYFGQYRMIEMDTKTPLTVSYEYNTPRNMSLPIEKEIKEVSVRRVTFVLTGENYDKLQFGDEYHLICGKLTADTSLIDFAKQIIEAQ